MSPEEALQLHRLYVLLSGLDLPYDPLRYDSDYFLWSKKFSADDLRLVIGHIKNRYKEDHAIMLSMLRWTKLFTHLDFFQEMLTEAKAMTRPPATEREKVLGATGRTESAPSKPAQKAGDVANRVLRGPELVEAMRKLRESLD